MTSEVVSGIVSESDLNESEKAALIAFKTALNTRLPQILPETTGMSVYANANPQDLAFLDLLDDYVLNEARLALTPQLQELRTLYANLPEKAQPRKLPENIAAEERAAMSESERALADFKEQLNKRLPEILPETTGMSVHVNGNTNDGAFSSLLESYVLNEARLAATPALSELHDLYNELPADIRAKTETYMSFFATPSTQEGPKRQGLAVVTLAERNLGTNDAPPETENNLIKIDERTSRALRERLEELQKTEDIDVEFDPRVFDQKAVDFLNALVRKRMNEANVPRSALDGMLVQLWALQNGTLPADAGNLTPPSDAERSLGEAVSLRNLMNFMVNAKLPSDTTMTKPEADVTWDTQWTNNDSGDRFFSSHVYRDLFSNKVTSTDAMFDKSGYSDENHEILMQAAQRLNIDTRGGQTLSELDVGKIAAEVLSIRAQREWCFISPGTEFDEKKIHEMIHEGQFMPHIDDLFLAEKGFGFPETEFFRKKVEEYGPERSWSIEYEERTAVLTHRARAFAERFGEMPQSAVEEKARAYNTSEDHIRHSYGTPSFYFASVRELVGSTRKTAYEIDRDKYLERYQAFKEDGGSCEPSTAELTNEDGNPNNGPCTVEGALRGEGGTQNGGPCTVEGVLRGDTFSDAAQDDKTNSDCIKTNAEDATGNEQGECTVESEVDRRMGADPNPTK